MHVRMQSQENVEISNPMYLREEADEDCESLDPSCVLPCNKVLRCVSSKVSCLDSFLKQGFHI